MQLSQMILTSAVAQALDIMGDRWSILILRDAFLGRHRFEEFRSNTGAPRSTLSSRLEKLVYHGILYKSPYSLTPARFGYHLTDKGFGLYPWALLIWAWERRWTQLPKDLLPPDLHHNTCNHKTHPIAVCRHCHHRFGMRDVRFRLLEDLLSIAKPVQLPAQRRQREASASRPEDRSLAHITDIIGDRWTILVLAASFFGAKRYDEFRHELGIATNILADRLKQMVDADVFARVAYQDNPPRYGYHLTAKGLELYPLTMALHQWVRDWLPGREKIPVHLTHTTCSHELDVDVIWRPLPGRASRPGRSFCVAAGTECCAIEKNQTPTA